MSESKKAPSGIGWWIWYLDRVLAGRTYQQFAGISQANGITHLLVKAGDHGAVWPQFAPCVEPFQRAGLGIYAWTYVYLDDPDGEAEVAKAALAAGADGLILDVEGEAEGKHAAAVSLWEQIRAAYPDRWVAWAPLPVVDFHDPEMYRIACRYADAHLPQMYWSILGPQYGDFDYLFGLWAKWQAVWKGEGLPELPILPIGQAYGGAGPPAMRRFFQRCQAAGFPAVSWWEWAGASEVQWETVAELAREWAPAVGPEPTMLQALDTLWGIAEHLQTSHRLKVHGQSIKDYVLIAKRRAGLEG